MKYEKKNYVRQYIVGIILFFVLCIGHRSAFAAVPLSQLKMVSVPGSDVVSYPNGAEDADPPLSISGDGRYVVFSSDATNFVSYNTRGYMNVYLYDTQTGSYTLISKPYDDTPVDANSMDPVISGNGRYIAYRSLSNIVPGDTGVETSDLFLYDRQTDTTRLISINDESEQANGNSSGISISTDGRYVAYTSDSTNLVPNDTNNSTDAFVFDTQTNTVKRVSVTDAGAEIPGGVNNIALAPGGGYAAFFSSASGIVSGDAGGASDVFVYDLSQDTIEKVSVSDDGTSGDDDSVSPFLSSDGRYVAFQSWATNLVDGDTNNSTDIFVHDRQTHTTERVSVATDGAQNSNASYLSVISADGTKVLFTSSGTSLVPGVTNSGLDVYMRDLSSDTTTRISVAPDGTESDTDSVDPRMSSDGRCIVFNSKTKKFFEDDGSKPTDLYTTYYKDTQANTLDELLASAGTYAEDDVSFNDISPSGRFVVFSTGAGNLVSRDGNNASDVFVYDRQANALDEVSVASDGTQGNGNSSTGSITSDGRYVAFSSQADNLAAGVDGESFLYIKDRQTGAVHFVTDGVTSAPSMAAGGRYVAFEGDISGIVPDDTNDEGDIFVYDMDTDSFERVSVASDGTQANSYSSNPKISADGRYVAFYSNASNLVAGDTNNALDAFVYDRQTHTIERVSIATDGTEGDDNSGDWGYNPSISDDGRYVVFDSTATNLVPDDTNGASDVFIHDRQLNTTERISVASDGTEENDNAYFPKISSDGRYVSFISSSTNLIANDENENDDIFLRDRINNTTVRLTTNPDGSETDGYTYGMISDNGGWLAFESDASELTDVSTNGVINIYSTHIDGNGPSISAIDATPSTTGATITWTTDTSSSSSVSYGTTTGYGSTATGTGNTTSHTVALSGLSSCTTYHYTVTSVDGSDNSSTSSDATFTTTGCSSGGGGGGGGGSSGSVPVNKPVRQTTDSTQNTTACVPTSIMPKDVLGRGTKNDAVGTIQQFLQVRGYYVGRLDKSYGPKTETAVRMFQLSQHLPATGIWDKTTGDIADIVLQCKTQPSVLPPSTQYVFTHNLKLGMNDADVLKLQQYLNAHGSVIAVSGFGSAGMETTYFGLRTKAALAAFQRAHNIVPASGFFGPITRTYINGQ